jgi:hypothetical protein
VDRGASGGGAARCWGGGAARGWDWDGAGSGRLGLATGESRLAVWGHGVGLGLGLDALCWWWAGLQFTWANGLTNFSGKSGISGTVAQNPNYPY